MALWSAIPILGSLLDKILPDRAKNNEAQNRINEAELSGAPSSILRLWRSFLGWVLALTFAFEVVGRSVITTYWPGALLPPPMLEPVTKMLFSMLGWG